MEYGKSTIFSELLGAKIDKHSTGERAVHSTQRCKRCYPPHVRAAEAAARAKTRGAQPGETIPTARQAAIDALIAEDAEPLPAADVFPNHLVRPLEAFADDPAVQAIKEGRVD